MLRQGLCFTLLALSCVSPALSQERFDLDCSGLIVPPDGAKPLSFEQRFSVDLRAGKWCIASCNQTVPIVRHDHEKLVLIEDGQPGDLGPRETLLVDLVTGNFSHAVTQPLERVPGNIEGKCRRVPFRPLEARTRAPNGPKIVSAALVSDDYPVSARRAGETGIVLYVVRVGSDGAASNCRIAWTSGAWLLDSRTCELVVSRFIFQPATDGHGQPVAGDYLGSISWQLP